MSEFKTKNIVIMGVSGCGKSTIGRGLAERLNLKFVEGDELHPKGNVEKMSRGEALSDGDRWPWLANCAQALRAEEGVVLSCSALKKSYRDYIREWALPYQPKFVVLVGDRELIRSRMQKRAGHFMPESLLDSQFATLELPNGEPSIFEVSIDNEAANILAEIEGEIR